MRRYVMVVTATILIASPCLAGGLHYIQVPAGAQVEAERECGACHTFIPPQEEPMQEWQSILENLPHHMGEDATLPEPVRSDIEAYLVAHASDGPAYRQPAR